MACVCGHSLQDKLFCVLLCGLVPKPAASFARPKHAATATLVLSPGVCRRFSGRQNGEAAARSPVAASRPGGVAFPSPAAADVAYGCKRCCSTAMFANDSCCMAWPGWWQRRRDGQQQQQAAAPGCVPVASATTARQCVNLLLRFAAVSAGPVSRHCINCVQQQQHLLLPPCSRPYIRLLTPRSRARSPRSRISC